MERLAQSQLRPSALPTHRWLWVDGVGGFLVCTGDECTIGQPVGGAEIGIFADISRRHATIRRDEADWVLEPLRPTAMNGQVLDRTVWLADRAEIQLGTSVRLKFERPHPYSNSARLTMASGHRFCPSCDGVLLAGDSLVLGPGSRAHVRLPPEAGEIVLYRQGEQWFCRSDDALEVEGQPAVGEARLTAGSRVTARGVSFTFEEAG